MNSPFQMQSGNVQIQQILGAGRSGVMNSGDLLPDWAMKITTLLGGSRMDFLLTRATQIYTADCRFIPFLVL